MKSADKEGKLKPNIKIIIILLLRIIITSLRKMLGKLQSQLISFFQVGTASLGLLQQEGSVFKAQN